MEPTTKRETEDVRPEAEGAYYMVGPFTRKQMAGAVVVLVCLFGLGVATWVKLAQGVDYLRDAVHLLETRKP